MWQDAVALTIVAVTVMVALRSAVRAAGRAGAGCSDCTGCAGGSDAVISADTLMVFSPGGRRQTT
jgi:hypothetical protein